MTDDRTAAAPTNSDLPNGTSRDSVRAVSSYPVRAGGAIIDDRAKRPARQRNLLATFRAVPGANADDRTTAPAPVLDPGFPGTRAFASRPADPGAPRPALRPAPGRDDHASAPTPRTDDPAGRSAAVQPAGSSATTIGSVQSAAESGAGGRVRGRRAGGATRGREAKEKSVEAGTAPIRRPVALPKAIAKLVGKPADPAAAAPTPSRVLVPTESERADARRLFREIGERFNVNRKKSKTAAYAAYRHDLMANLDTLIMGGAIDLKEVTTVITNLEQYTKETEQESTETPATVLGRWLRMAPGEMAELEAGAVEELEGALVANESDEEVEAEVNPADEPSSS